MRILYAIQATGNGHISRAHQIMPYLLEYGSVDTVLSGTNSSLDCAFPVTYRFDGLSLFYKSTGGLDFWSMIRKNRFSQAVRDARHLPTDRYDVVINDFDLVTALSCRMRGVRSVHFGHQASFISESVPRPEKRSIIGESILKYYAKSTDNVGLHFDRYSEDILPPIIKRKVLEATPQDNGHYTVYLPSVRVDKLISVFSQFEKESFHVFSGEIKEKKSTGNVSLHPVDSMGFTDSMITSRGVITGGGFETPAEALYLKKKLMVIPIKNHYEQACNAAALREYGTYVISDFCLNSFVDHLSFWLSQEAIPVEIEANDIAETINYIVKKAS